MTARRHWLVWGCATWGILAIALFVWFVFLKKPVVTTKPQPVSVSVAQVSVQDVPVSIVALGTAQAWASDTILAQVSGMLISVDFIEGSNVKAGQLLAQVDPGNLVTTSSATSMMSGSTGTTTSPIGIVTVNQIEPIAVTFSVPQGDYQRLSDVSNAFRKPLATQALSQDTGASLGTGELSIADNRVDPTTGTVQMKARFANAGDLLLPGQFVNVKLTLQTLSHATTVPAAAVNQGPNGSFAYVVGVDQTVSMRPIKVGSTQGATAVITSGLQPGETVVTDGQMSLGSGSTVRASVPAPATQPAS